MSTRTTRARVEILQRSAVASDIPPDYKTEILRILEAFKPVNKARNFYCHAAFSADDASGELVSIEGYEMTLTDEIVKITVKPATRGLVNEIRDHVRRSGDLNRQIWPFLQHLRKNRKAHFLELRPLPAGYPNNPNFPPLNEE